MHCDDAWFTVMEAKWYWPLLGYHVKTFRWLKHVTKVGHRVVVSTRFLVDVESVLGTIIAYGRPSQMDLTLGCYMCMLGQE
jgi:hypothetical protein